MLAHELDESAISVLQMNDRGGYTVPTARLYPYQWNWDSAFVALGFATFDRARAWRELTLLFEGQWDNGMVPSILFRRNDPDYFPGPSTWQAGRSENGQIVLPSTGISQPPVVVSIVLQLVEDGDSDDLAVAKDLFDQIWLWHDWFHRERTPDNCPVVATVHPWETGRDNCPDWNIGLDRMSVDPDLEAYTRKDILHADPNERPSQLQYDKYLTMLKFGRDHDWDQSVFTNQGPFLMVDPCIHFVLLRADRDLLILAEKLGRSDKITQIKTWIEKGEVASDYLWNDDIKAFCARDVKTGEFSRGFTNASALCFYADAGTSQQRDHTLKHIERVQSKLRFMLPSWDPDLPDFEAQRYWCGPIWPQMNYMISRGLHEQGEIELAARFRNDMAQLITQSGFGECFNPATGEGCVGTNFSWTAAIWLAWALRGIA